MTMPQLPPEVKNMVTMDKFQDFLNFVTETAKTGKDFVVEQTPLLVQEVISWEFWNHIVMFLGFGLVAALFGCLFRVGLESIEESKKQMCRPENDGFTMFCMVFTVVFAIMAFINGKEALRVCVAPRVIILEKTAELMKDLKNASS